MRLTAGRHGNFLGCSNWLPNGFGCNAAWLPDGSRLPPRLPRSTRPAPRFAGSRPSPGYNWRVIGILVGLALIAVFLVGVLAVIVELVS